MNKRKAGEKYSAEETAARAEETLRRMLATPPQPRKPSLSSKSPRVSPKPRRAKPLEA